MRRRASGGDFLFPEHRFNIPLTIAAYHLPPLLNKLNKHIIKKEI